MDQSELEALEARFSQDGGGGGRSNRGGKSKTKGKGPKSAAALRKQLGPRWGLGKPNPKTAATPKPDTGDSVVA